MKSTKKINPFLWLLLLAAVCFGGIALKEKKVSGESYETALKMAEEGNYTEAIDLLYGLGDYPDAKEKMGKIAAMYVRSLLDEDKPEKAEKNLCRYYELLEREPFHALCYELGCEYLEKDHYKKALKAFTPLKDNELYTEKINEAIYRNSVRMGSEGSYMDAFRYLYDLGDYKDSREQASGILVDYVVFLQRKGLPEKAEKAIEDYRGAETDEDYYRMYFELGKGYLEADQYTEAKKAFDRLNGQGDYVVPVKDELYRYAEKLYDRKDYEKAAEIFNFLNYKDSRELNKDSKYQQACILMHSKTPEKAVYLFNQLKDYKDSADLLLESKYLYGKALMRTAKYETAARQFGEIPEYKDSASQKDACNYRQGLAYLRKTENNKARQFFAAANDYGDSKKLISVIDKSVDLFMEANDGRKHWYQWVRTKIDPVDCSGEVWITQYRDDGKKGIYMFFTLYEYKQSGNVHYCKFDYDTVPPSSAYRVYQVNGNWKSAREDIYSQGKLVYIDETDRLYWTKIEESSLTDTIREQTATLIKGHSYLGEK